MFCLYAAPDWTGRARYFAPYMPVAMLLLAAGALAIVRRLIGPDAGTRVAPFVLAGLVATIALPGMVRAFAPLSDHFRETHPGYVMRTQTLIEPALWMRDNLPPGATIATRRIGALAYFSGHRVFDYTYGLTSATRTIRPCARSGSIARRIT
jgi:hypothetical protein